MVCLSLDTLEIKSTKFQQFRNLKSNFLDFFDFLFCNFLGYCGSCWTYSVAQVVDALARKKNMTVQTSPQQMIDCDHQKGQNGCNGGWPPHGLDYAVSNGLSDLQQYPIIPSPAFIVVGQPPPPKPKCHYDKSMEVVSVSESITVNTKGKIVTLNRQEFLRLFCVSDSKLTVSWL
jgi:Papain family cysteine protease